MFESLFSPIKIGSMEVKNRVVMTAMGNHLSGPEGAMSDDDLAFYGARADGGVGLVITECVIVDYDRGKGNLRQLSAADDSKIEGLSKLADRIHRGGAKAVVQIYHPGRQGITVLNSNLPMPSPSDVECQAVHQPVQPMTVAEIQAMVDRFGAAARRLKAAGFDGVEIHGAHGYLITQFLSPYTNKRTDEYGGSFDNRFRFLEEIVKAVQASCGPDWPILVRLSVDEQLALVGQPGEGLQLADGIAIAKRLEALGVAAIDVSCGIYETMNTSWEPMSFEQGWKIHLPEAVKKEVGVPVIGVSVIRDPAYADELIKTGKLDLAGSARQNYADPEWPRKAKEGRVDEIRKCVSCLNCMRGLMEADETGATVGCAINIAAGNEVKYGAIPKGGEGRPVAVIGAGPAGLEAARVLALRGFKPVLFEKKDKTGGQIRLASVPPGKGKLNWLTDWLELQMKKLGVDVRLGAAPSLDDIKKLNPYAVFVAQGSKPSKPTFIEGLAAHPNIYDPWMVLEGKVAFSGPRTVVVGSGLTGLETSLFLAEKGQKVAIYEMLDEIGPGVFFQNLIDIMTRLGPLAQSINPGHKLLKISNFTAFFEKTSDGEKVEAPFDDLVLALGALPETALVDEIKSAFERVVVLGDASKPGRIREAMESGFMAAFNL